MTAPEAPQRVARLDSLTGLRWWAAFGVFAHHMTNLAPLPIFDALSFGNYGVMFFFVLSGFVLTWSSRPGVSAQTFWVRRFARIYPAHFVALLLAIPVFYTLSQGPHESWVKPFDLGVILLSVFLLQGWSRDSTILFSGNPAAWTLTCEAFFYALHPAMNSVLRVLQRRGTLIAALAVVAFAFAWRVATLLWPAVFVVVPLPVARLSEFALGMVAAHALRLGWRPRIPVSLVYAIGAVFVVWLVRAHDWVSLGLFGDALRATANEWIMLLCVTIIVATAMRDIEARRSVMRWKPLVTLGDWSYSFYLIHATAIYALAAFVGKQPIGWSNLGWYAGVLVLAIALAAALHLLVEKPVERRLRAAWDRRLERRALAG